MPKCSLVNRHCRAQRRNARSPSDCVRSGRAGKMVRAHFRPKEACRRQSAARTIETSLRKRSARKKRAAVQNEAQRTIARAVRRHNDRMKHNGVMDALAPFAERARTAAERLVYDESVRRCVVYVYARSNFEFEKKEACVVTPTQVLCTTASSEMEYLRNDLFENGQPFVCVRTTRGWQATVDTSRGRAVQPTMRAIDRVDYAPRVVIQVAQPDGVRLNFYLSTGTSNPGHDFPNTFFRNGHNELTDRYVYKCHPLGTWLDDLLRLCCVGESLVVQRLDDGTQVTVAETMRDLRYEPNLNRPELVVDAADVVMEVVDAYRVGYVKDGALRIPLNRLFTDRFRLAACKNMDLLLIPTLTKFCNWRDAQLSACLGGLWDLRGDYVAPTHHYYRDDDPRGTLVDFGAVQRLKYVLQHYDYDQLARAFVPRDAPLVDLSEDEKARLRVR